MVEFRSGRSPVVFGILRFVGGARPALARFPGAMGFACGLGRGVPARFLVSWPGEVGRVSGGCVGGGGADGPARAFRVCRLGWGMSLPTPQHSHIV